MGIALSVLTSWSRTILATLPLSGRPAIRTGVFSVGVSLRWRSIRSRKIWSCPLKLDEPWLELHSIGDDRHSHATVFTDLSEKTPYFLSVECLYSRSPKPNIPTL